MCTCHQLNLVVATSSMLICHHGSFFRLQNMEGLTLVGLFKEGTTLTCLETYSDAKKRTLSATIGIHTCLKDKLFWKLNLLVWDSERSSIGGF